MSTFVGEDKLHYRGECDKPDDWRDYRADELSTFVGEGKLHYRGECDKPDDWRDRVEV